LREKSEAAKKILTSRKKTTINLTSQGKSLKMEVTKEMFEDMIASLLNRTSLIMETVLGEANYVWTDIDKVLVVGGSTRIPAISDLIKKTTGKVPSTDVNPDEVVALGAAIQTLLLNDDDMETASTTKTKLVDVNSHSLGIISFDTDTNTLI